MVYSKPYYRYLYLAGLLMALHYALTVYINSSFLLNFFSQEEISRFYVYAALLTIACLVASGRFIKKFGNFKLVLAGLLLEAVSLIALPLVKDPGLVKFIFIVHQALPPLLLFGLDIFFEGTLRSARDAEKIRSYYLTSMNVAFVCAPLVMGALIKDESFTTVYIISALCVVFLWFLVFDVFRRLPSKPVQELSFVGSLRLFVARKNLGRIFLANLALQCFFALIIIFMGPHLHTTINLSWKQIGVIYTIMLIPFALFEAPLGKVFDKIHDERDILISGFIIMSTSVMIMASVHSASMILWAALLFMSRVGASFVEVAAEASFFRSISERDAGFISIFRLGAPMAYVIAPLAASFVIPALPISALFTAMSIMLLGGAIVSYRLKM